MNRRHLKMHSETYGILSKRCTTKRGYIQPSITDLQFSSKWRLPKYHCLTICPLSGVQSKFSDSVRNGGCLKYHCLTYCPLSGVQSTLSMQFKELSKESRFLDCRLNL